MGRCSCRVVGASSSYRMTLTLTHAVTCTQNVDGDTYLATCSIIQATALHNGGVHRQMSTKNAQVNARYLQIYHASNWP